MKLAHKIYLIIAIFILPLAGLAVYSILTGLNKDIDFAADEMMGNEYQRPLEDLLDGLSQHQSLVQRAGSGDATASPAQLAEAKASVDRGLDRLLAVDAKLGERLQFTKQALAERDREKANAANLKQEWTKLTGQLQGLPATEAKARHFELIELVRTMISHSGDKSNLILDPDLDSYYLMDMSLIRLPANQERIAVALAFGTELLARQNLTAAEIRKLDVHAAMLREVDCKNVTEDLKTSLNEDKNFFGVSPTLQSLSSKVAAFETSTSDFAAALEKLAAERSAADLKSFLASGERARRESFLLWDATATELDRMLELRMQNKRQIRLMALLITAGILLGAGVFSFLVIRGISRSIDSVAGELHELSAGEADLTRRITVTGSWELQKLAVSFNNLMGKLLALIKQVQQSGAQVTSASTEIAASTKQLEAAVTEQAASTNEVVATTREISATSQSLVQTMGEVGKVALETAGLAGSAQGDLGGMENTMRGLAGSTGAISAKLAAISDKANNIGKIVIAITKVADQTNLLSLNASIEAEKAGEHGLGFAVVAREIRRLADQTAVATLDIERMVKEMQSSVSVGVMEMDKFTKDVGHGVEEVNQLSAQLTKIMDQVQALAPRFETVTEGMQAQSQGAQQISTAMVQLSDAARQTMDSLKQTNGAIMDLNSAARGLYNEVSRFRTGG